MHNHSEPRDVKKRPAARRPPAWHGALLPGIGAPCGQCVLSEPGRGAPWLLLRLPLLEVPLHWLSRQHLQISGAFRQAVRTGDVVAWAIWRMDAQACTDWSFMVRG